MFSPQNTATTIAAKMLRKACWLDWRLFSFHIQRKAFFTDTLYIYCYFYTKINIKHQCFLFSFLHLFNINKPIQDNLYHLYKKQIEASWIFKLESLSPLTFTSFLSYLFIGLRFSLPSCYTDLMFGCFKIGSQDTQPSWNLNLKAFT